MRKPAGADPRAFLLAGKGDQQRRPGVWHGMPVFGATEAFKTLVLNPASAVTAVITFLLMQRSQISLQWLLNPWALPFGMWLAAYAAIRVVLLAFVDGMCWMIGPRLQPLPSRTGPKPVFQHKINTVDVSYLIVNSLIEFIFAQQIGFLLWHSPMIVRAPWSVGLLNGPVALWLILVVDDMLYAPLHRFMHHPAVYRCGLVSQHAPHHVASDPGASHHSPPIILPRTPPLFPVCRCSWVHKHHHRNTFPARGYIDAANEHPVEQISALTLHWIAVHIVATTVGLHVAAVGAHFGVKALGACFNHTGYDLQVR